MSTQPQPAITRTRRKVREGVVVSDKMDKMRIAETRPLSKEKRWRISKVLEKAK